MTEDQTQIDDRPEAEEEAYLLDKKTVAAILYADLLS